jgi:uncharacterized protein YjbI with pentapeptide repeats
MGQEQQTPGDRALELIRVLLPNWQPTTQDVLRWIRLALAVGLVILGVLLILDIIGLLFGIRLLNLVKILAVPITVGAAVPLLNWAQTKREREAQAAQRGRELEVENRRAQDAALLAYLDKMDGMLLRLRESSNANAEVLADTRTLIRARTLSIVESLDRGRKGALMRFLSESGLLKKECPTTISLRDADFGSSDLIGLNLIGTDLQEVLFIEANLGSADLSGADLRGADLTRANLSRARLGTTRLDGADLNGADLRLADLSEANLKEADLRGASLRGANLSSADLTDASLTDANLRNANLRGARGVDNLRDRGAYLRDTTLPNGQIAEKSPLVEIGERPGVEDGENTRPS